MKVIYYNYVVRKLNLKFNSTNKNDRKEKQIIIKE